MKDSIFKKIKENVKNAINLQDDDDDYIDDDEDYGDYDDEDYDAAPQNSYGENAYTGTSLGPDPYTPYGASAPKASESKSAPSAPQYTSSYQPAAIPPATGKKGTGNIYKMNGTKASGKMKVALFALSGIDDTESVANAMIERNIVIICDFNQITPEDQRRVLDFLDGVKYVCNSRIENISGRIFLIVPEMAELSGDFFSQVDASSLY